MTQAVEKPTESLSLEDQLAASRAECAKLQRQVDGALKALDNPRKVVGDLSREALHDIAFRDMVRTARDEPKIKEALNALGAFTFFDLLDTFVNSVIDALQTGTYETLEQLEARTGDYRR